MTRAQELAIEIQDQEDHLKNLDEKLSELISEIYSCKGSMTRGERHLIALKRNLKKVESAAEDKDNEQ